GLPCLARLADTTAALTRAREPRTALRHSELPRRLTCTCCISTPSAKQGRGRWNGIRLFACAARLLCLVLAFRRGAERPGSPAARNGRKRLQPNHVRAVRCIPMFGDAIAALPRAREPRTALRQ